MQTVFIALTQRRKIKSNIATYIFTLFTVPCTCPWLSKPCRNINVVSMSTKSTRWDHLYLFIFALSVAQFRKLSNNWTLLCFGTLWQAKLKLNCLVDHQYLNLFPNSPNLPCCRCKIPFIYTDFSTCCFSECEFDASWNLFAVEQRDHWNSPSWH